MSGTLFLVATPLGNLEDMSPRATRVLEEADYIAAEDTRRAARLLSALGVGNRLISYYEHNQAIRHDRLIEDLKSGLSVAVVSDAGMPSISDPGEALVRLAVEHGIPVSVIPGPSAFASAISASGLNTERFAYEGFIPAKGKERQARLKAMSQEVRTLVFYEAPHRLRRSLDDLAAVVESDRKIVVAREMTKTYEEFLYFTLGEAVLYYETTAPKGEFTIVLEGKEEYGLRTGEADQGLTDEILSAMIRKALDEGLRTRDASDLVADKTGVSRNKLYRLALKLRQ